MHIVQWRHHDIIHIRDVGDVGDIHDVGHVDAIEAASIPRIEIIVRAAGQPSDRAKASPKMRMVSKANKEHISRGIDRAIRHIHWSRPPIPIARVDEPAAIVIWRPTPRLIRDPGPAIVGFPYPASILIRRPAYGLGR